MLTNVPTILDRPAEGREVSPDVKVMMREGFAGIQIHDGFLLELDDESDKS